VPARLEGDTLTAEIERRKAAAVRSGIPQKVVKFYGDGLKYFPAWWARPENRRWVTPGITIVDVGSRDDGFSFEYCGTVFRFVLKSRDHAYSDGDGIPKTLTIYVGDRIVCEIDCSEWDDQYSSGLGFETLTGFIAGPETELLGKLADEGQAHAKEMARISGAELKRKSAEDSRTKFGV